MIKISENAKTPSFEWTNFYMKFADKLLEYKNDRKNLVIMLNKAYESIKISQFNPFEEDGKLREDICPFTIFSTFNIRMNSRIAILKAFAKVLGITEEVPKNLEGIPIFLARNMWFFGKKDNRKEDDISNLWELFEAAINYADNPSETTRENFISNFDKVSAQYGIKWKITIGLYWIRPYSYLNLDEPNREYLLKEDSLYRDNILNISNLKNPPNGNIYLDIIDVCKEMFKNPANPHHSFPELSYEALKLWENKEKKTNTKKKTNINKDEELALKKTVQEHDEKYKESKYEKYTKEDFLEKAFMDEKQYNTLVNLLTMKKNLILQGPPGVGKTFVAKRLAYSIIGEKDTERVTMIQFHQSYSYEDFILGYRPKEDGFELKTGPFYEFCKKASKDPTNREYFFIIDEINRGNISKIFGELLMLIEKDKRGEEIKLLYTDELFTVPENLYIIGTMNTADRSIAIIDYALRRRFSFFDLKPAFESEKFETDVIEKNSNPKFKALINTIKDLNKEISRDDSLGEGFQIGHSYFCPNGGSVPNEWLENIVEYEIIPLLKEYWYDNQDKLNDWIKELKGVIK